jgi:FKBP-type peptidyl-prolyl cis-trans isomerase FklB
LAIILSAGWHQEDARWHPTFAEKKETSMNVRLLVVVAVAVVASSLHAQERAPRRGGLTSIRDKASYSFGMTMGSTLKKQGVDVDVDLLIQGLRDATGGGKTALTEEQAFEAMQGFEKEVAAKQAAESKRFLVENKKRPGVKATSSGLQYKILKQGRGGARPKADDVVSVNYRAMFVNGVEFENNGAKPFVTPLGNVIPGWQEALQLMDVGAKWQLFVPAELAYGEQGQPPAIGPNATLVFEVELVAINKPSAPATPGAARPRNPEALQRRPVVE